MSKLKKVLTGALIITLCFSTLSSIPILRGKESVNTSPELSQTQEVSGVSVFPSTQFPLPSQDLNITFQRTVTTNNFLYTVMQDRILIKNRDAHLFNGFRVFFPVHDWKKMKNFTVRGEKGDARRGLQWKVYLRQGSYLGVKIHLPWYIPDDEGVNITLSAAIPHLGEFNVDTSGQGELHYNISAAPRFLHQIDAATTEISAPKDSSVKTDPTSDFYKQSGNTVTFKKPYPYSLQFNSSVPARAIAGELTVYWKVKTLPLQISFFSREVKYKLSNKLLIKEHYTVSASPLLSTYETQLEADKIETGLLKGARNITVTDSVGDLSLGDVKEKAQYKAVTINFRVPVSPGRKYSFTVSYTNNGTGGYLKRAKPEKRFNIQQNLSIRYTPYINASIATSVLQLSVPRPLSLTHMRKPKQLELTDKQSTMFFLVTAREERQWMADSTQPYYDQSIQMTLEGYVIGYLTIYGQITLLVFFIFTILLLIAKALPLRREKRLTPEKVRQEAREKQLREYIKHWERYVALEDRVDEEIAENIEGRGKRTFQEIYSASDKLEGRREELYRMGDELKGAPSLRDIVRKLETVGSDLAVTRKLVLERWRKQVRERGGMKREFKSYTRDLLASLNRLRIKRERLLGILKDKLLTLRS